MSRKFITIKVNVGTKSQISLIYIIGTLPNNLSLGQLVVWKGIRAFLVGGHEL